MAVEESTSEGPRPRGRDAAGAEVAGELPPTPAAAPATTPAPTAPAPPPLAPVPRELLVRALPAAWIASYLAVTFLVAAIVPGVAFAGRGALEGAVPFLQAGGAVGFAAVVAAVVTLLAVRDMRRDVAAALGRRPVAVPVEDVVALAPAFLQTDEARRPPGVLVVTRTHLRFFAAAARDATRDVEWPLVELDEVMPAPDRFDLLARVADMQGALAVSRAGVTTVWSVAGSRRVLALLSETWSAARSPPAREPGAPDAAARLREAQRERRGEV